MDLERTLADLKQELSISEATLRRRCEETNFYSQVPSARSQLAGMFLELSSFSKPTTRGQELLANRRRQAALEERSARIAAVLEQVHPFSAAVPAERATRIG